jgi:hypothetical protein
LEEATLIGELGNVKKKKKIENNVIVVISNGSGSNNNKQQWRIEEKGVLLLSWYVPIFIGKCSLSFSSFLFF